MARSTCCFNPCSLGCCSERVGTRFNCCTCKRFQSLFSWMLLWKSRSSNRSEKTTTVSILVLLDVALKVRGAAPRAPPGAVSILVLLDVALKVYDSMESIFTTMFQSLFSWMLLWKLRLSEHWIMTYECFNPCSLGCCSESVCDWNMFLLDVMFQSLFSWMLLWKRAVQDSGVNLELGFNPCSLGCCSERIVY